MASPVLVINLDRDGPRLEHMRKALCGAGLGFERITALAGNDIQASRSMKSSGLRRLCRPLLDAEVACFLSHRRAWLRIVDAGYPHALVLEDDLHFAVDFADPASNLEVFLRTVPIVRFDTLGAEILAGPPKAQVGAYCLYRTDSPMASAAAYALSRDAARFLLDAIHRIDRPIDELLFGNGCAGLRRRHRKDFDYQVGQLVPAPCIQDTVLGGPDAPRVLSSGMEAERRALGRRPSTAAYMGWLHLRSRMRRRFTPLRGRDWIKATSAVSVGDIMR